MLCKQAKIIPSFEICSPANEMLKGMLLSFSKILLKPLSGFFYHSEFL